MLNGGEGLPTDYTFTGQKDVPGTGLMYYGARYYEPALGRFVSADTVVPEPGNPQDLNRYAYVRNNPLGYVDPSGHWLECGSYLSECKSDTYYAGASVLNGDPEVQAYLDNAMDPHRYLASVEGHIVVAATNAVVDDVVGMIGWRLRQYFGPLARRVITRLLKTSDDVAAQFLDDAAWASQRAAELREQLGRSHDFGSTMAAATTYDENGTRHLIIGANEGRRSVQLLPEEIFVGARGIDAEQSIVNFANANNLQVSVVEATRPICPACEFYIVQAGGLPLTTKSGEVFLPVLWKW